SREENLERNNAVAADAVDNGLPPLPKEVPAWESLSQDAKKVYARMMENYSAYLEYTDAQIGRVIGAIAAKGQLDNTLIIYIVGDNGASAEGGLEGTVNGIAGLNGIQLGLPGWPAGQVRRHWPPRDRAEYPGRLGNFRGYSVPVDQAGGVALRRNAQPDGDQLAETHPRQGWAAFSIPSLHRRRSYHLAGS